MLYTFSGQEKNKLRMRDLPYLGFKFIIRFRCSRVGGAPRPFLINDIRKWCAVRTLQGFVVNNRARVVTSRLDYIFSQPTFNG